jgi:hypothetical protein
MVAKVSCVPFLFISCVFSFFYNFIFLFSLGMKLIKSFLFCLLPFLSIAQSTSIIGEWEATDKKDKIRLVLNNDFSGSFDGITFSYVLEEKELVATYDYGVFHYEYELKNGLLTLKEGNLEHPYIFTKVKSTTLVPAKTSNVPAKSIDNAILGNWTNGTVSVQFTADGGMQSSDGKSYTFETKNNNLQLFLANTFQENPYSIQQGYLNMVLNGQIVRLKKQQAQMPSQNDAQTGRKVLPELSGKWCFISSASPTAQMSGECVVLTGDGSYIFMHEAKPNENAFLEQGEWWATNSSLYFLTKHGQADTFQLAKKTHPSLGYLMLNIDGRNFISADKRTDW